MSANVCIFCKIIRGETQASLIYRDESVVALQDIQPVAPTHILIVPVRHIVSLQELGREDEFLLGKVFSVVRILAVQEKIDQIGYRLVVNTGSDGGQTVFHLHWHLIGGRRLMWPPG